MGAASTFGRDELGINSPTHRNTHAEEDLFGNAVVTTSSTAATTTTTKTDLLDDIFKTCPTTINNSVSGTVSSQSNIAIDDDLFNPRAEEPQEFGDFETAFNAFGSSTQKLPTENLVDNNVSSNSNSNSHSNSSGAKDDEFADFGGFETHQTSSNTNNDPANLLFAVNTTPNNAQTTASISNQKVGDLLSDLDGLSLDVAVPTGKFATFSIFTHSFSVRFILFVWWFIPCSLFICFFSPSNYTKLNILHLFRYVVNHKQV